MIKFLICAALALAPGYSHASDKSPPLADIRAQQLEIRERVQGANGAYRAMSPAERAEIVRRQDEVLALIDGKQSLDELNDPDKVAAFNSLEWIKAKITDSEDQRVICERARPVGSNRVERICATVAERRANQEAAETALRNRPLCGGEDYCPND
ncbi:MAG: hypothetical protein ABI650_08840 [Dokdonella sp.]